ncbi:D-alanyl-D-alanine carboxypeptidase family protein (plasmid) [Streptomyces sp. HUAS TT11]|uniref:D-alanyl-D-alanine carboxypeptidase family protein n=1 Tax=Streptomyces sp. HUAS TT11 TaxID=3447508 RepID=UPI003F65DA12
MSLAPARAHARSRNRITLWSAGSALIAVIVLLGSGLFGFALPGRASDRGGLADSAVAPGVRTQLPWPSDGQAALWVEGVGDFGTSGKQVPVPIASVAKVMTAYLVLQNHPLHGGDDGPRIKIDDEAAAGSYSSDESATPVRPGASFSQRDVLQMMMVTSGNNIARLLARWDAGAQSAFVKKMNERAAALGMDDTYYTDPSGFDKETTSTAADQLKLARTAMKDPAFRAIVATEEIAGLPDAPEPLPNTNKLLGKDGVIGLKTGSSTPAGGNLAWAAHRTIDGKQRLAIGIVLHQSAGTTPAQGLEDAFTRSQKLIRALDDISTTKASARANG